MTPRVPLPPKHEVNDEIQDICFNLLTESPFYGGVMQSINRCLVDTEDQKESTQMSTLTMASVKLDINYKLWAPLTSVQKRDRLQHEVLHFVFLHPWKEKPDNLGVFYMACDLSANQYCNDQTSFRAEYFDSLCRKYNSNMNGEEGYLSYYDSILDLYRKVPAAIMKKHKGDQDAYNAEIVMWQEKALKGEFFEPNTKNLTEAIVFLPKNSQGDANASGLSNMVSSMKGSGAGDEEIEDAIQQYLANNPDPWKEVSEGTSSTSAEEVVKRILSDAKNAGNLPGGLQEYVDILLTPPLIDWRRELRKFTKNAGDVTMSQTMTRRSKRFGKFPSSKIKRLQRIAIAIDTSGSMSDDEFNQAISEVSGALSSDCEVIVIQADCQIDDVQVYRKRLPQLDRISRFGNGGTSFHDPLEYVRTGGKLDRHAEFPAVGKVDGMVYITDGYAPAPEYDSYPRCKVMWLTTQKSVEAMEEEGFLGRKLFIDCSDM